jgi:hypothetical protein
VRQEYPFSPYALSFFDRTSAVVVMVAYFDASEAGGILGVGGYLFRKKNVRPFEKQWRAMLRKHDLDHFHMTDCNMTPPQGPFAGKEKADCDDAARLAIAAIKEHATNGFSAAVRVKDFDEIMGPKSLFSNPFSLCAFTVLTQCAHWANQCDPQARITYVFEAGDEYQADANKLLQSIADFRERREKYHYENHAFLPKRGSMPTQAADILAWHICKQWEREERGIERMRGDFAALVDGIVTTKELISRRKLHGLIAITKEHAPDLITDPARFMGLALRVTNENAKSMKSELFGLIRKEDAA